MKRDKTLADRIANLSPEKRALLESRLKQNNSAKIQVQITMPRRQNQAPAPLSFAQQRLWFLDQLEPESSFYNVPHTVRLQGSLNVEALREALNTIVDRHEILRTTISVVDGNPIQVIRENSEASLSVVDLSETPEPQRQNKAHSSLKIEIQRPFDLSRDLMLRATLLKLGRADHILLLITHHIASDGWSTGILWGELAALYRAFSRGEANPLPELPVQYADYAVWQRQWLHGKFLERQLSYWKHQLAGISALDLPRDRPRPAIQTYRGDKQSLVLPQTLSNQLQGLSRKEGVTLFMTLLAAFQTLLHRYSGQDDIVVGSPIAGRTRSETEGLIGFFVNTLVLRNDLSGNPPFRDLLHRVRQMALGAYEHQDIPFDKLVEELHPDRDLSRSPLFQVMFAFQNAPRQSRELPGLTVSPVEIINETAKFDLSLYTWEEKEGLRARLEYNTDLFDAATIHRMLAHFATLVQGIVTNPDRHLSDLPILTEIERSQLLIEWNDTQKDYPKDKCIHELFEEQVEKSPDAIAVVFEDEQLTYRELNTQANQLAHYLRNLKVGAESLVGVCMERSLEMIIGLLGVLKAGGAYVPLDPAYPKERLAFMLEDSRALVVLTQRGLLDSLPPSSATVVCVDREWKKIVNESDENPDSKVTSDNSAYVIYTSGSTGKPKGVAIEHRSPVAFLTWTHSAFAAEDLAGVLASTSICFDLSVFELFAPLTTGGRVILAENALALPTLPAVSQVTLINTVPSAIAELLRLNGIPPSVRTVNLAGEPLGTGLVQQIYEKTSAKLVYDLYGPSEDTTYSTYALRTSQGPQTIGRPISNTCIYILDGRLNPTPTGIPGELYLGGVGLARGYLNRPDLTAERFVPDPFSNKPGARLYRTGDVARYLSDANVEFLGRIDHQVKVRGFRIELGEIEAVLSQHPDIDQAIAVDREIAGDKRLIGYVVPKGEQRSSTDDLKAFLRKKLPEYMVPSAFVFLDALPLTPNGKVDRKVLPKPDQSRAHLKEPYAAPRTPIEELLKEVWAEVLRLEQVGIHDNFFELGGHSLLATQVVSRIRQALQVELPLRDLFANPTVAGIAERIEESRREEQGLATLPLVPVSREKDLPLSFAQQRLWFLDQLEPERSFYNIPYGVRLQGPVNVEALRNALNAIVNRHEILRTTINVVDGNPIQVTKQNESVSLSTIDLSKTPELQREDELHSRLRNEIQRPFDLSRDLMLRATLLRFDPVQHILLLVTHHIASDGWSTGILWEELATLYEVFSRRESNPLLELPIQYADYAVWQRQWLQGEVLERQLLYWKKQLSGVCVLELPTDRPRPAVQTYQGSRQSIELSKELTQELKALSRKEGVTLFMILLAAFQTLLYRYSGQEDIAVGAPIAGRTRSETEGLIGFFVNTLVLRSDLSGDPTFREFLDRVRKIALEAYEHQDIPFEKLVQEVNPARNLGRTPLFQVVFALQNVPRQTLALPGLTVTRVDVSAPTAKFDLFLAVRDGSNGLTGSMEYNTDLFGDARIAGMLRHYERLLESIVADPEQRISELAMLSGGEEHQLLNEWNDTDREYPKDKCIQQLFEEQVEKTPEATAVIFGEEQLTYRDLNKRANQLAHHLRKLGVGPDVLVGICVERSLEMVIGLLGILKAGGAYLPLDPGYPPERLRFMLEDTSARVLLTQQRFEENLPKEGRELLSLNRAWGEIGRESEENLPTQSSPENLAYVIYTSGSTGKPKGVEIPHKGIVRLICGAEYARFDSSEVFLQLAPIAFDASTFELWGALANGAQCVLFPGSIPSPQELGTILRQYKVSTLWLTASLFNAVIEQAPEALSEIRQLLTGGETLSVAHIRRALSVLPDTRIINGYGPTESTTFTCCYQIPKQLDETVISISIGRPISNTQVFILDSHLKPVPIGVVGELYIGGDGLARGYVHRPGETAGTFIPNPFSDEPGARLYKSGDLARYLAQGGIEFIGRLDDQVKIRGFRIELGEIENTLKQHPSVRNAVVVAKEDNPGNKGLVGYIILNESFNTPANELKKFLKYKLPEYMVPTAFVFLDTLPLTANGKVDRQALPPPDQGRREIESAFAAPQNELQQKLVKIWEKVIGVNPIGIKDNFFDLGGHSLIIVRLIAQIEKAFGKRLPPAILFQAPTVEQLADIIGEEPDSWSSLVPIQPLGTKPPFFWIHGEFSNAILPRYLGLDQPLYGLEHQSQDGKPAQYTSVETIATHYLKEIRMVQSHGPYFLGGYSLGSILAFEIASRLIDQAEDVALLALLDPPGPSGVARKTQPELNNKIIVFNPLRERMRRHYRNLAALGNEKKLAYFWVRGKGIIKAKIWDEKTRISENLKKALWKVCLALGRPLPVSVRSPYILNIYRRALRNYVPRQYTGRVVLFKGESRADNYLRHWRKYLLGEITIHDLPGNHMQLREEPYIHLWAEKLKACLEEAQAAKVSGSGNWQHHPRNAAANLV